ncbi:MAG: DUF6265 family protein [Bacteroidota bacterium]
MKSLTKFLSAILLCTFIISCSNSGNEISDNIKKEDAISKTELDKVCWMIGTWENKENGVTTTENWRNVDKKTLIGVSFSILKNDTISFESISIQEIDSKLYYIPLVKGQNDNKPVKFELQSSTEKQVVFVNLKHDFPQKITYNKITKDSLYAEIQGKIQGKERTIGFPLKRKK